MVVHERDVRQHRVQETRLLGRDGFAQEAGSASQRAIGPLVLGAQEGRPQLTALSFSLKPVGHAVVIGCNHCNLDSF